MRGREAQGSELTSVRCPWPHKAAEPHEEHTRGPTPFPGAGGITSTPTSAPPLGRPSRDSGSPSTLLMQGLRLLPREPLPPRSLTKPNAFPLTRPPAPLLPRDP